MRQARLSLTALTDNEDTVLYTPNRSSALKQIAYDSYKNPFQNNTLFDQDATVDFLKSADLPRIIETIAEMIDVKITTVRGILSSTMRFSNKQERQIDRGRRLTRQPICKQNAETNFRCIISRYGKLKNYIASKVSFPDNFKISLIRIILCKLNQNPNLTESYRPTWLPHCYKCV